MRLRAPRASSRSAIGEDLSAPLPSYFPSGIKGNNSDDLPLTADENKYKRRRSYSRRLQRILRKLLCQPVDIQPSHDKGRAKSALLFAKSGLVLVLFIIIMAFVLLQHWTTLEDGTGDTTRRVFPIQVKIEGLVLSQIRPKLATSGRSFPLIIPAVASHQSLFHRPPPLDSLTLRDSHLVDYGNLAIYFMEEDVPRVIFRNPWDNRGTVHESSAKDDDVDVYYSLDDDYFRDNYRTYDDDDFKNAGSCRRVSWHRLQFPNCNTFHEMDRTHVVPHYLSYGSYRDVFVHPSRHLDHLEPLILKSTLFELENGFTMDMYEFTRVDALISERFTSSDRIVDIYGHCGLSILSEFVNGGDVEDIAVPGDGFIKQGDLHDHDDVKPQNNFTTSDKLLIALEMAESIVLLHNYPEGRIVHDDIQMSQFLHTRDGYLKLNDFNRAEIMLWDEERQEYCKYRNGLGNGNYRAPEEYLDKPLDEKIDVYSFGNSIYALLTGLWPFYEDGEEQEELTQRRIANGEKPYVDARYRNRSLAEGILVQVMEACWAYRPQDRPSMAQVIQVLHKTVIEIENGR